MEGFRRPALVIAACCLVSPGWAVEHVEVVPGVVMSRWEPEDGIPSGTLYTLAEDELGRLVLGTSDGVGFYDGVRFTIERQGDPIAPPDDRVLWVGTAPHDGSLWLVTQRLQAQRRLRGDIQDFGVLGTTMGGQGLRRTADGLFVHGSAGLLQLRDWPTLIDDVPPAAVALRDLPDGRLVLLADGRVMRRVGGESTFQEVEGDERLLGMEPGFAAPWALTPEGITHRGRLVLSRHSAQAFVSALEGEPWVAFPTEGLVRLHETAARGVATPDLQDTWTSRVVWDPATHKTWAAFPRSSGWWDADDPLRTVRHRRFHAAMVADELVRELTRETENLVLLGVGERRWWAAAGRLWPELSAEGEDTVLGPPTTPRCASTLFVPVTPDLSGRAWLAWGAVIEHEVWRPLPGFCGEDFFDVRGLAATPHGMLFAGTRNLVLVPYDAPEDPMRRTRTPLPEAVGVRHLHVEDGVIWLSTEQQGLCVLRLDALGAEVPPWRCAGRAQGLDTQVHAAIADGLGRAWLSTNHGLVATLVDDLRRLAHGEQVQLPIVRLGKADGLASEELNGYAGMSVVREPSGVLWFPGREGVTRLDPAAFSPPARVEVGVATVRVGGVIQPPGVLARLPAQHEAVVLELAVRPLTWAAKAAIRYRTVDGPWVDGGPTLTLGALPAGATTIEVQSRVLGPWETVLRVPVVRQPRLTEQWFFPVGTFGLSALVGMGVLVLRNRALTRRREELQGEVNRQTDALRQRASDLEANQTELVARSRIIEDQAERLRELDRLKSEFIADIAHELRTPLTLLLGSLEHGEPADVAVARRNAESLHMLVEQLFQLRDMDKGRLPMRARRVDLVRTLQDSVAQFTDAFAGRELVGPPSAPWVEVWANASAVRRVVANLLQNALRYGQGRTEVRLAEEGAWVRVEVLDQGPGVPPSERDRVFERFVQLSTGDTRVAEGMGIGLAMVKELVELHGGEVGVGEAPGGGACFWFTLPLGSDHLTVDDIENEVTPHHVTVPPPPREPPAPSTDGPVVLVVEDNEELRSWLVQRLAPRYRVIEARDGEEGLEAARQHRPAAIVSDVRMPRKDGLQMVRELRAHPALGKTPVMFLSAKAMVEDRVEGLQIADDYLCKPFGTQELLLRLARLIGEVVVEAPTPDLPLHVQEFLDRLAATADRRLVEESFGVNELAKAMAMSARTLQERMKALSLPPPGPWLLERRLARAQELLREGRFETVGEVAVAVGLSRAYLSRTYRAWSGVAPSDELKRTAPAG